MFEAQYTELKNLVDGMAGDVEKANNGNKSAKIRLRATNLIIHRKTKEFRQLLSQKEAA